MFEVVLLTPYSINSLTYVYALVIHHPTAPTAQLTLTVESHVTSATLSWNTPSGYETIASSGGVRYTVTVENMATGRKYTVMASDVSITETLVHSTEYCFTVRPEVSGGSGVYSERKCITVPGTSTPVGGTCCASLQ